MSGVASGERVSWEEWQRMCHGDRRSGGQGLVH
jgi:hypothetical protein